MGETFAGMTKQGDELAEAILKMLREAVDKKIADIMKERGYATDEEAGAAGIRVATMTGVFPGSKAPVLAFRVTQDKQPLTGWIYAAISKDDEGEGIVQIREE